MPGCNRACKCGCGTSSWKMKLATTAVTAVAGVACYAGCEAIKQKYDLWRSSQSGTSSSTEARLEWLEECAICQQKMKPRKHFNCRHHFHDECISQCFSKLRCPICKAKQIPDSEADWEFVSPMLPNP